MRVLPILLLSCVLLTQCGVLKGKRKAEGGEAQPADNAGSLRNLMQGGPDVQTRGGAALAPGSTGTAEGGMFDFSGVVQTQAQNFGRVGWHSSVTTATQEARQKGKPLLILFTHQGSSSSRALENTLILTPEFRSLVDQNFVPLRINFGDSDTRQSSYYRDFKTRLEAKGYPTVVVTLADGTEVERLAGYNEKEGGEGTSYRKAYLGRLERAVQQCETAAAARRKSMEAQGFRYWSAKTGTPVFARLESLDANKASFIGEWGDSFDTFLNRLSDDDRAQIELRRSKDG